MKIAGLAVSQVSANGRYVGNLGQRTSDDNLHYERQDMTIGKQGLANAI